MENAEINNIIKIMGLQFKQKYDSPETLKTLRYGKIMIMTDQDVDGSHIKGLLINFIHHYWPSLLKQNVIVEFITPIVKVGSHVLLVHFTKFMSTDLSGRHMGFLFLRSINYATSEWCSRKTNLNRFLTLID